MESILPRFEDSEVCLASEIVLIQSLVHLILFLGSPYWPLEPGKRLNQKEINSKNKLIFPDNKWLFRIASQLHPGRQFQTETRVMNLKTKKS